MSRWGKPTKNKRRANPRYFLKEQVEFGESDAWTGEDLGSISYGTDYEYSPQDPAIWHQSPSGPGYDSPMEPPDRGHPGWSGQHHLDPDVEEDIYGNIAPEADQRGYYPEAYWHDKDKVQNMLGHMATEFYGSSPQFQDEFQQRQDAISGDWRRPITKAATDYGVTRTSRAAADRARTPGVPLIPFTDAAVEQSPKLSKALRFTGEALPIAGDVGLAAYDFSQRDKTAPLDFGELGRMPIGRVGDAEAASSLLATPFALSAGGQAALSPTLAAAMPTLAATPPGWVAAGAVALPLAAKYGGQAAGYASLTPQQRRQMKWAEQGAADEEARAQHMLNMLRSQGVDTTQLSNDSWRDIGAMAKGYPSWRVMQSGTAKPYDFEAAERRRQSALLQKRNQAYEDVSPGAFFEGKKTMKNKQLLTEKQQNRLKKLAGIDSGSPISEGVITAMVVGGLAGLAITALAKAVSPPDDPSRSHPTLKAQTQKIAKQVLQKAEQKGDPHLIELVRAVKRLGASMPGLKNTAEIEALRMRYSDDPNMAEMLQALGSATGEEEIVAQLEAMESYIQSTIQQPQPEEPQL